MNKTTLFFPFLFSFPGFLFSQEIAQANVSVTNFDEQPIAGAEIYFIDTDHDKTISAIAGKDGKFIVELPPAIYNIRLKSVGKTKDYTFIEIPTLDANESYGNVEIIIQYEEESSFTLSDLNFETNKSIIKPTSFGLFL